MVSATEPATDIVNGTLDTAAVKPDATAASDAVVSDSAVTKVNGTGTHTNGDVDEVVQQPDPSSETATADATEAAPTEPAKPLLPVGSVADFKRVDERYNKETYEYDVTETAEIDIRVQERDASDLFGEYCFNVVRRFDTTHGCPTWTKIQLNSKWLKRICSKIIGNQGAVAWSSSRRVLVDISTLLRFFGPLRAHLDQLRKDQVDPARLEQLQVLLDFVRKEHADEIDEYESMVARKDIMFDYIGHLYMPDMSLFFVCPSTNEPRAARVSDVTFVPEYCQTPAHWKISAVYLESTADRFASESEGAYRFGWAKIEFNIFIYKNTCKIFTLKAFPMDFHPEKETVCRQLVERGLRWRELDGIHHVHYNAAAAGRKVMIQSRIMIDNVSYKEYGYDVPEVMLPNRYHFSEWDADSDDEGDKDAVPTDKYPLIPEPNEEQLLFASPIVYGFSLSDKLWLAFNVVKIQPIAWNDEAFANLVLPDFTKDLVRGLVESQSSERFKFDDFIEGKGRGIVICLAGGPGVGKTMSAEASTEHLRRPLYIVGGGELPTHAGGLDTELTRIFNTGARWGAVVLIDEADVFLEKRSVHDLKRNALVAVFLRQLEYFPGMLFLTTNRMCTFDEAFQSRIHVSLRYRDLDEDARRKIWRAFIAKLGDTFAAPLSPAEETHLVGKGMNGRQIKNAVRTAGALASSRNEKVAFTHLKGVVDIMEQFERDFSEMSANQTAA